MHSNAITVFGTCSILYKLNVRQNLLQTESQVRTENLIMSNPIEITAVILEVLKTYFKIS
jgi:hypothetical protein